MKKYKSDVGYIKHLEKDNIVTEPMCLADIYNIDVEVYKTEDKTTKIGF